MIVVGIDCGKMGALAALREDGVVMLLRDAPILQVGKKREYDLAAMADLLRWVQKHDANALVAIERVWARPGEGAVGAISFGEGSGIWLGAVTALGLRLERVTPMRWRKAMLDGLPKGKGSSMQRAKGLFPDQTAQLARKKDDGRAEALLIAEFARRSFAPGRQVTDSEETEK
jgi:crossover junction endodeoxyribonuclease RuvC